MRTRTCSPGLLLPVWLLFAVACGPQPDASAPTVAPEARPDTEQLERIARSPGLAEVMRRTRFAYREEGTWFRTEQTAYAVQVDAQGTLRFTPHATGVQPEALTLRTASIQRTEGLRLDGPGQSRVEPDGTLAVRRGEVTERLRNGEAGVEQSWDFERRPEGRGDLVVRVDTGGLGYVGADADGLRFEDARTQVGVRYGVATWVDADGVRTPVAQRYVEGTLELTVPADVVERSAYPAVLDPIIATERGVDVATSAAPNDQRYPSIAWSGSRFLAVWQDKRGGSTFDVYAARLDSTGRVLDAAGILVAAAAGDQGNPKVEWTGATFLVVWDDTRAGNKDLYARALSPAGALSTEFVVASGAGEQATPDLACNAATARCVVVYYNTTALGALSDIFGRFVTATATDGAAFQVSFGSGSEFGPVIASAAGRYAVAWQDGRAASGYEVRATRILESTRVVEDPTGIPVATGSVDRAHGISTDGTRVLVTLRRDAGSLGPYDLYGRRFSLTTGALLDAAPVLLDTNIESFEGGVATDGTRFAVTWVNDQRVKARRIDGATGALVEATPVVVSSSSSRAIFTADVVYRGDFFFVWEDNRDSATSVSDIYGAALTSGLLRTTINDVLISTVGSITTETLPDVAFGGGSYLAVWQNSSVAGSVSDIQGVRIALDGNIVEPRGFPISTAAAGQYQPAVSYGNGSFLVVWADERNLAATGADVYGARVSTAGAVLDAAGIAISSAAQNQTRPDVAFDGTQFLVAWTDTRTSASGDIYGTRVSTAGAVAIPAGVALSTAASTQTDPAVAFGGGRFLVTWSDSRGPTSVYGALVSTATAVLVPDFAISPADTLRPAVAFDGTRFMVAWEKGSLDSIQARPVTTAGALGATFTVSTVAPGASHPALAFDGDNYLAVWARGQRLYGSRFDEAGTLLDSEFLITVGSGNDVFSPAAAASGPGNFLVGYERFDTEPSINRLQVFMRRVSF